MENLFVSHQLALMAKEKGFNEACMAIYSLGLEKNNMTQLQFNIDYSIVHSTGAYIPIIDNFFPKTKSNSELWVPTAPLYQQLIDWFRDKHNIHIVIDFNSDDLGYSYCVYYKKENGKIGERSGHGHDEIIEKEFTYYEALNKALVEAFKLI